MSEDSSPIQEKLKLRRLNSLIQPSEKFKNLPIKPGADFFIKLSLISYPLKRLQINFPDILVMTDAGFRWIRNSLFI